MRRHPQELAIDTYSSHRRLLIGLVPVTNGPEGGGAYTLLKPRLGSHWSILHSLGMNLVGLA